MIANDTSSCMKDEADLGSRASRVIEWESLGRVRHGRSARTRVDNEYFLATVCGP